ncbi:2-hydroxy-3-oxopropionate reductase [Ephemeroptericola cinctiostellae]|uniref:2-hydroxy-3-oxopropionate reductase n=1 Tax=Ephemeroptericola cinctiostellae TaxID=2268024 RepID=A0A345DBX1_9BURK|nr:NAD(P)-dependent oxidoreductase [Ephemeroptericola cinctiostellae]AXF85859.1 2-hydroxy-3-oxopropionate reductase [Ephemeroptericola cinctiostellae]
MNTYSQTDKRTIAFLGLGVMGAPMAGHLAHAGHRVVVYNRTTEKAMAWCDAHATFDVSYAKTPAQAAIDADFIMSCLGNDDDVTQVLLGDEHVDGAFSSARPDAIFCDHTTASATLARELYVLAEAKQLHFIDAPVSGGQVGAINGQLTIMCGGSSTAFELAQPIMSAYAQAVTLMGVSGCGQLTKMVNQICIAGLLQGLSEAIAFGEKSGLDMEKALQVIGKGAAQSWQLNHRGSTMLQNKFDFGFAVDWMRKDLGLVFDEAAKIEASLPITTLIDGFYKIIQQQGGQRWDTSSLITLLHQQDDHP